jgi:hypothetical protein
MSGIDKLAYYDAWAQMMITIWQDKIGALNIRDTGTLFSSFVAHVESGANGDVTKITHTYQYYGRMVDMGVGKGVSFSQRDNDTSRKAKPWYNKSYYRSIRMLSEKAAVLYGEEFQAIISETLNF